MTIHEAVGTHVRLVNNSDVQIDSGRIKIHCHGKLEFDPDEKEFYVRVSLDPQGHGCNGVAFSGQNVLEVFRQPSGIIEITLKG